MNKDTELYYHCFVCVSVFFYHFKFNWISLVINVTFVNFFLSSQKKNTSIDLIVAIQTWNGSLFLCISSVFSVNGKISNSPDRVHSIDYLMSPFCTSFSTAE